MQGLINKYETQIILYKEILKRKVKTMELEEYNDYRECAKDIGSFDHGIELLEKVVRDLKELKTNRILIPGDEA